MTHNDLVDYIFVTQPNDVIANICETTLDIIELLPLEKVKELVSEKIDGSKRLAIYFKINNLYPSIEEEMASFIDYTKTHLIDVANLNKDIVDKNEYITLSAEFASSSCITDDFYYYFSDAKLLDKNKEVIFDDFDTIYAYDVSPLDECLDNNLGEYIMKNSPCVIKLNY